MALFLFMKNFYKCRAFELVLQGGFAGDKKVVKSY